MFCSPALFHNSYLNKWCIPFPAADRSVVYRSEYYKWQHKQQRPVRHVLALLIFYFVIHPYV